MELADVFGVISNISIVLLEWSTIQEKQCRLDIKIITIPIRTIIYQQKTDMAETCRN